jgi:hypothetical protein
MSFGHDPKQLMTPKKLPPTEAYETSRISHYKI